MVSILCELKLLLFLHYQQNVVGAAAVATFNHRIKNSAPLNDPENSVPCLSGYFSTWCSHFPSNYTNFLNPFLR